MKSITLSIGLLIIGAITPALADDAARISALEAKVQILETQNLSLKAAIEAVSGKTLAELLTAAAPAMPAPPDRSAAGAELLAPKPDPAKLAQIADLKSRIAAAEEAMVADQKTWAEAEKAKAFGGRYPGVTESKADREKRRTLQSRTIAEWKAKLAALEQ
jgi:hypothetical protein